ETKMLTSANPTTHHPEVACRAARFALGLAPHRATSSQGWRPIESPNLPTGLPQRDINKISAELKPTGTPTGCIGILYLLNLFLLHPSTRKHLLANPCNGRSFISPNPERGFQNRVFLTLLVGPSGKLRALAVPWFPR